MKRLIQIYTDPGDVVIDPCAGSGSTLRAAAELGRNAYGFEINREMCARANREMLEGVKGIAASKNEGGQMCLFT